MATKLEQLLQLGQSELGKPYSFGAEGPNMFDCSGLMQFLYAGVGIPLPRTAAAQQGAATPVSRPVPGDLVFYGSPAHHVALYLGGGLQLAAPHSGDVVQIQRVSDGAAYGRVAGLGNTTAAPLAGLAAAPVVAARNVGLSLDPSTWVGAVAGAVKPIVYEGVFVALGIGLIGYGAWRAVGQRAGAQ